MGAFFGSKCHATQLHAAGVECSETAGTTSAGYLRCSGVGGTDAAPQLLLSLVDGAAVTEYSAAVSYPACDPAEPVADMLDVFGLAVLALAGVWVLKHAIVQPLWSNQ